MMLISDFRMWISVSYLYDPELPICCLFRMFKSTIEMNEGRIEAGK